jgi:choline-glycine betaine transporter
MDKINKHRLRALSNLSGNFSEIFLASLVIPIFNNKIDLTKVVITIFGIISCIGFAYLSLLFAEKGKL